MSSPDSSPRGGAFTLCATALLTGLAGGALSCLIALAIKQDPVWLMPPLGLAIGTFMRWQRFAGARGALAAAGAMLVCIVYAEYLYAAVRMADMLGFPLRDTFFRMDWRLAWQLVRSNTNALDALVLIAAPLLAAFITRRIRA